MEIDLTEISKYYHNNIAPSQNTIQRKLRQFGMERIDYFLAVHKQDGKCLGCGMYPDDPIRSRSTPRSGIVSKMLTPFRSNNKTVMLCDVCFDHMSLMHVCEPLQVQHYMYKTDELRPTDIAS